MSSGRHRKKGGASKGPGSSKSKKQDESSGSLSTNNLTLTNYPTPNSSEFKVEEITGSRYVNGQIEMQVKWAGFPPEESTWEPLANLRNCMVMVSEFAEKLSRMIKMDAALDLQASSCSKESVGKKASAIKASPALAPGERQLETGEPIGPESKANQMSTPQPNSGPNIGEIQKKKTKKLLPALHLHLSDDETPSTSFANCASATLEDQEISSYSNTQLLSEVRTSNASKKAKRLNAQGEQAAQSQAKQNMAKTLTNPNKKHLPQAKAFAIQNQENSTSETPEDPIEKAVSDMHSMKLAEKGFEVQVKDSKKSKEKIQKQESSDDDSDSALLTPYQGVFGLARGLELDKVVHSFRVCDRTFLFVTWKGTDVVDTVPLEDLKDTYPAKVLEYFQKMERRYK